jgi:5-methylcytosine-specific restriction endonuclease McrA
MSKHVINAVQRYAIWSHHGKVCRWCGAPIRLLDTEVDHVVPEHLIEKPDVLSAYLHECGLDLSFPMNDYENWIPIHSSCNKNKSGRLPPPVPLVVALLAELRESAPKVRAIAARVNKTRMTDQLLAKVMAAVETGDLSRDELRAIADVASDDADASTITEEFRVDKENWSLLARIERAVGAGFYASMEILATRDPATLLWSPAFARADLAHHIEPIRSSNTEDFGSLRVLLERLPGEEFLSRMRRALQGQPLCCAGLELTEHGLNQSWRTESHHAYHEFYSDWPCVHGLSAQFPRGLLVGELVYGPPGGPVHEDGYSLVARLLRVPDPRMVSQLRFGGDPRGRCFNLIIHDPRGRIVVERTLQGLCVRADVMVPARLVGILTRGGSKGGVVSINREVPLEGVKHDVPGEVVAGKLKLWSRTGEPIDEWSWPGNIRPDWPPPAGSDEPLDVADVDWSSDVV